MRSARSGASRPLRRGRRGARTPCTTCGGASTHRPRTEPALRSKGSVMSTTATCRRRTPPQRHDRQPGRAAHRRGVGRRPPCRALARRRCGSSSRCGPGRRRLRLRRVRGGTRDHRQAARQLAEYFDGVRTDFDVPLDPVGTEFQRAAWSGTAPDPVRRDGQLRRAGRSDGRPEQGASGRRRQRAEPDLDHRPVPPCRRQQRLTHRLRRRRGRRSNSCLDHERRVSGQTLL